jgi:hypothetical protein
MRDKTPNTKIKAPVKSDQNGKSNDFTFAEIGLSAPTLNAITSRHFTKSILGETHLIETINVMKDKVSKVNAGDLSELEATLTSQSVALDTIFNDLAKRAIHSDTMSKLEVYMRLSLKAQSQCARTIEVLAAMKNPPIVYARQANIAHGNQQVNNLSNQTNTHAHAEKIINQPNELLEVNHGSKEMDGRTTRTTSNENKAMATMEPKHGGKNN